MSLLNERKRMSNDKRECIEYARYLLDTQNVTYLVSNFGNEIEFASKKDGSDVTLCPTTGTFTNKNRTFKEPYPHNKWCIKANIKYCLQYHINEKI